jgi:Protein of unknown function (DUF1569)
MRRRAVVIVAALPLAACGVAEVKTFPTLAVARSAIASLGARDRTDGAWPLPKVLNHLAQSVEYSMDGYPELKSALFRSAIGGVAFAVFEARGKMGHSLSEPIPGAPALDEQAALEPAKARLLAALQRFETHPGELAPHFAYGALDKAQYLRAHLMHLANHWTELAPT